ncbi:MAG: ABC transporter permease subunit [Lachnospiraceae bacterium]|nr:ABC transporter permease subunit [Lachnospiraceae bacterium]
MTLFRHEWKMNYKSLLIWAICVGICCGGCILLFESVAESMEDMAETFAQMGGFSAAFGMDKVSIATIDGFYAAEISIIFSLGGAMFAAMTGAVLLSKEEEGHTAEFLHTLPVGRGYIFGWKYGALLALIVMFNVIGIAFDLAGFLCIGQEIPQREYLLYHFMSLVMQIEIGSICFFVSAVCKRKQLGLALGLAVLLYIVDIMVHIVPDLESIKWITPYYFANAADIFSSGEPQWGLMMAGAFISVLAVLAGGIVYRTRDITA